jgi:hypothetical protein
LLIVIFFFWRKKKFFLLAWHDLLKPKFIELSPTRWLRSNAPKIQFQISAKTTFYIFCNFVSFSTTIKTTTAFIMQYEFFSQSHIASSRPLTTNKSNNCKFDFKV